MNDRQVSLVADCANCVGLCCVALAFTRSDDFAFGKDAGEECRNLTEDFRCRVHSTLRTNGMRGCTVFDCNGAGQRVTQSVFAGANWRESRALSDSMFAVFHVVRQLHEMLWYLTDAARACAPNDRPQIDATADHVNELCGLPGDQILALDLEQVRELVNPLLIAVSAMVREEAARDRAAPLRAKLRSGSDLIGANLSYQDLRGADLRGTLLIAADLTEADLRGCDLLAADLRKTNLRGADLSTTLFVTQMQLNAADGDPATRIPVGAVRPSHWT